jgi:quercetin dioxygenase-like cupin family protein
VKNHRTSVHYHQLKDETFYIQAGKVWVYYSDELAKLKELAKPDDNGLVSQELYASLTKITLNAGDTFYVPPRRVHQIMAVEDTELIEFSTKHFDEDSIRLIKGE